MKFAKELEQDLVPEWRAKYFDYKTGKKKVKAVAKALKSVNQTPKTPGRQLPANLLSNSFQSPIRNRTSPNVLSAPTTPGPGALGFPQSGTVKNKVLPKDTPGSTQDDAVNEFDRASPVAIPGTASGKGTSDDSTMLPDSEDMANYGSFVASPPRHLPDIELPDPALPPEEAAYARHNRAWRQSHYLPNPHVTPMSNRLEGKPGDAFHIGKTNAPPRMDSSRLLPKRRNIFNPRRAMSTPDGGSALKRPRMIKRMLSTAGLSPPSSGDVPLEAYREYDACQADYFGFLDKELEKIEIFYKSKETQATARLQVLREQLHEMRDRRIVEVRQEQQTKEEFRREQERIASGHADLPKHHSRGSHSRTMSAAFRWMQPIESAIGIGPSRIGRTSKALQQLTSPYGPQGQQPPGTNPHDSWRDFERRPTQPDPVPYRSAKRKLKLALQEFYRGLELLKSYALLNRTAFRKINKKYDKAVKARPTGRYMSEKVNKAWFVQSEVLEGQIVAVEDLYARYFERGNHKVAVGKLRSKTSRAGAYMGSVFRNGLLLAGGAVFGVQGIVYGGEHLSNPDVAIRTDASYLLQIYGGYFLGLFLFLLFCLDCKVWTKAKINYPFIFEFDVRHNLDWHQLAEIPCLLFFMLGLFVWLNFQQGGTNSMYLYWPVILIGLTVIIIFFPGPILYHRSREWWAYSNWRLLLAGLYPVEFRDFFLGDMYCSETYSMGNLEIFFCLYARNWNDPQICNSSNSRLLGFFSTLPGILRALQCLRRYYDTRNAFPHLVNCGKYTFTILSYLTLSLYRIDKRMSLKALFIACSTVNSVYCSIWDLAMDWSLGNPYAEHPFLRKVLGYKRPWVYYLAMILDPILRFNWIFYAIYSNDLQHSALLSFFVGFSEVCRRGMWTLFRVENEHCTNVGRFRASRDVPLPYEIYSPSPSPPTDEEVAPDADAPPPKPSRRPSTLRPPPPSTANSTTLEPQPSSGSLRRRFTNPDTPIARGIARVGNIMGAAHTQDFERKRRPDPVEASPHHGGGTVGVESSDEEEEDDEEIAEEASEEEGDAAEREEAAEEEERGEEDVIEAESILRRRRSDTQGG